MSHWPQPHGDRIVSAAVHEVWRGRRRCTKVCPKGITITDNAIIPVKERMVDDAYDPVRRFLKLFMG